MFQIFSSNSTIYTSKFKTIAHQYPTCFSENNFNELNRKQEFFKSAVLSRAHAY